MERSFEDQEITKDTDSSKYRFKKDGKKHTLIIQEATLDDAGMYHAWTNGGHTKGELEVEGTAASLAQPLVLGYKYFMMLNAEDRAELNCWTKGSMFYACT